MTDVTTTPIAPSQATAPHAAPSRTPAPSRSRALSAPEIRIVAPLDVRQVLNISIDETVHTRVWVASPEKLLSADVVTQGLRKTQRAIRQMADTSQEGFDNVACELRGNLGAGSTIADPIIVVLANGRAATVAPRRR